MATYTSLRAHHLTHPKGKSMKILNKYLIAGITAISLSAAALGTSAIAAPADEGYIGCPMNMGCPGPDNCYADHNGRWGHNMERWHEYRHQRQADLQNRLKLNADQEKAWKAYIAVVDADFNSWKPLTRAEIESMTAPQRMQTMLDRMKEHEGKMAGQLAALKTFYNKLTPEQQKTFDDESLFNQGYHHRGYGYRGGYGHRGGYGPRR